MNEKTNEVILAEIVAELEELGVIAEPSYDELSWSQKASIVNKLDIVSERVGNLVDWLKANVPEGVDALGLVEMQLQVEAKRESRSGEGE